MIRLPLPLTVPSVDPDPDSTWTLTVENSTVGLPPTPLDTYVGASTAVPLAHDGAAPVPPDVTACPAVAGMHSQPGVTAHAADAREQTITIAPATARANLRMSARFRPPRPLQGTAEHIPHAQARRQSSGSSDVARFGNAQPTKKAGQPRRPDMKLRLQTNGRRK
jgi:hypothetical protein